MNSHAPESPSPALDLARLAATIGAVDDAATRDERLQALLALLVQLTNAAAAICWWRAPQITRGPQLVARQLREWRPDFDALVAGEMAHALADQQLRVTDAGSAPRLVIASAPLPSTAPLAGLQLVLSLGAGQALEPFLVILQLMAGHVAVSEAQARDSRQQAELATAAALLELLEHLTLAAPAAAAQVLADELHRYGRCQTVVVAIVDRRQRVQVQASAGLGDDAQRGANLRAAERVANDMREASAALEWQATAITRQDALAAFGRVQAAAFAASFPLRAQEGDVVAVISASWRDASPQRAALSGLLILGENLLARALRMQLEARRPWWQRGAREWLATHRRSALAASLMMLALLWVPVPFRIAVEVTLVPAEYRYITAPFAGVLEQAYRRIGDRVTAGEHLAQMDGHLLSSELTALQAEIAKAAKQQDIGLAQGDSTAAQLARYEVQRLEVRRALLLRQQGQLRIDSPLAGIVIAGELDKARGAAVETGQVLFEIAPLDTLQLEALVADEDIGWVATGQPLRYDLDAYRGATREVTIARIRPRAELRGERNVFVLEAPQPNADGGLQPGMSGRGQLRVGARALGWVLLHKPWSYLRRLLP